MGTETRDIAATCRLIHRLADAAREATLPHFRNSVADNKAAQAFDPVTEGDRAGERALREILSQACPHDAVVGEEYPASAGSSGWTWYLDPIDGTRAFVAGLPSWTTLIGLAGPDGTPVFGCIDQPVLGERYLGWPGGAAMCTPEGEATLSVSSCNDLREAVISTTDPFILSAAEQGAWTHLRHAARLTRYGLDGYAYARLAAGSIDLVAESGLKPWDAAALIPVVRGAGGLATDWHGRPASAAGGQLLCCAGVGIQEQALLALRRSAI